MADYLGTSKDDVLDQQKLGLADWSGTIRGLGGNDTLTGAAIHLQGGAGNDVLVGTVPSTTANYWDSPAGVNVNLQLGVAQDGWGGQDKLINIHIVQGSGFSDQFTGSDQADNFWVGAGDSVQAGGGVDTVTIWDLAANWQINKITSNHQRAVQKTTGKYVDLINVEKLQFQDVTRNLLYEETTVYQDVKSSVPKGAFLICYSADVNKDGRWDLVIGGGIFPPLTAIETPPQILIQQANGGFVKSAITGSAEGFVHPREMASGDFNGDGLTDIAVIGHGYDISPFPGETPTVLLGQKGGGFLDASESLPGTPAFTHSLAVADVNGDGRDDLFLGNIYGQNRFIPKLLISQAAGGFAEAPLPTTVGRNALSPTGTLPIASLLRDVTGDGIIDLIAGGGDSGVFIYKGLPSGRASQSGPFFSERTSLPVGRFAGTTTIDIQSMDINRDGLQDLMLSQTNSFYQGRAIQLLVQQANGNFVDETNTRLHDWVTEDQWITFINLVDLNQDGHTDMLASGTAAASRCAYINDGTGHFYAAGPNNGVPVLSGDWLLPAQAGRILSVQNSPDGLLSVRSIELSPGLTGPGYTLPALAGAPGFNEQYYLAQHPEVATAVAAGLMASGLASYLAKGASAGHRAYAPGTVVWGGNGMDTAKYSGVSSNYTLSSNPSGVWGLSEGRTGAGPKDTFNQVERLQFSNKMVNIESKPHASYADLPVGLYQFFITAFNATPGVTYMDQLAEAYRYGLSVKQIVDIFTTKSQFTDVYPTSLSHAQLAQALVNNIVKTSATVATKQAAVKDITDAMTLAKWTVGQVIYQVFGNLANFAYSDPMWGNTAEQFANQIAVAKTYTDTLSQSTTDMATLRSVMAPVSHLSDVSTQELQISLIGQALLNG
jgi:hypothetical protein